MRDRPERASDAIAGLEPLCRYVLRDFFAPPGHDAADLMQEARIGAWKAWRDFRTGNGSGFSNFAEMCIRRQVITMVKTATRHKHSALNDAVAYDTPTGDGGRTLADVVLLSEATNPERRLIDRERLTEALEVLRMDLTGLERRCLLAVELDAMTYEDIATALNIAVKTVDNAVQRARKKLAAHDAPAACDICGVSIDRGRRCSPCEDDLDFAKQFIAA